MNRGSPSGDSSGFSRAVAEISSAALLNNFGRISRICPDHEVLPMIKADAYGHGAAWAAKTLKTRKNLAGFGVATLAEGMRIRERVNGSFRILVFSDAMPWTEESGRFCRKHGLEPVIGNIEDWRRFTVQGWPAKLRYHMKFNTGMNRLGLPMEKAEHLCRAVLRQPPKSRPQTVLSHLAAAESPSAPVSRQQFQAFREHRRVFSAHEGVRFHLANSAAIWNHSKWGLGNATHWVRPGISLYGVVPWPKAPRRGLRPVMRLKAPVLACHTLKAGQFVGYGGTFRAPVSGIRIATVGAGYADGVLRSLGRGKGRAFVGSAGRRILGVISMDLCAVECAPSVKQGQWVEFLGPRIDAWTQAQAAGTIPYELLTSVSPRVKRIYG